MPKTASTGAPASFAEGAQSIIQAISATMTAPDAAPHLPQLAALQKGVLQLIHMPAGQGGPPGAPPGGPPGQPPGGAPGGPGGIAGLMGQGAQPPGGMPPGGGGGPSASGASSDDIRRMIGQNAGTPG